ncbi:uncharacterized protein I303_102534 [Kwoniella dejecticola CBS 10117]|uniref:Uncharacterized protein n=1 Tax=Kwoniella dejecticola CBS 10117 TaxID=1296121 RepID=A0AAJ8ME28_9TREE
MPLPFFLQPLLLVTYWHNRLKQKITRWFQRSIEQLFGPLEQMVVAIVILGLAMQPPPLYWTQPFDLPPPSLPQKINDTASQIKHTPDTAMSTGIAILDYLYTYLPTWLQISPINVALLLMFLNVGILLVDDKTKQRLRQSWNLFWPPWQHRHTSLSPTVKIATPTTATRRERETAEVERSKMSERSSEPEKAQPQPRSTIAPAGASRAVSRITDKATKLDRSSEDDTSPMRADGMDDVGKSEVKDKGKSRMDGERPSESNSEIKAVSDKHTVNNPSDIARSTPTATSVKPPSPSESISTSKSAENPKNVPSDNSADGASSNNDIDDPLMAGDYKPLKSALKKTKKKPRQTNNIQHNYFMTMRGYRPSLIPFPYGFHPKPHEPKNSLWWDNVPKNADHIMAPPKVAKEPEKDIDTDEKSQAKDEGDDPKGKKEDKEAQKNDKRGDNGGQSSEGSSRSRSKDTSSRDGGDDDQDKSREREKLKAQAEAKARAQKEAEAKMRSKEADDPRSSTSSSSAAPISAKLPVDPQVQKATYLSQGLLSILLYYLHPQLGFLLLIFFIWQYINAHNQIILSKQALKRPSGATSSNQVAAGDAAPPKASAPTFMDKVTDSKVASDRDDKTDTLRRIGDLEKMIKKTRSIPGDKLTPEYKERVQKAMSKRKELIADLNGGTEKPAIDEPRIATPQPRPEGVRQGGGSAKPTDLEELEKKAKEMEQYLLKARSIPDPTDGQKAELAKVEERRKELWKQVRMLNGNEPASLMPPEPAGRTSLSDQKKGKEGEPVDKQISRSDGQTDLQKLEDKAKELDDYVNKALKVSNLTEDQKLRLNKADEKRKVLWKQVRMLKGNEPYSSMPGSEPTSKSDKVKEYKKRVMDLQLYIERYRRIEDPTDEQREKLKRAEKQYEVFKKEVSRLGADDGVGSSGMTAVEKQALASNS